MVVGLLEASGLPGRSQHPAEVESLAVAVRISVPPRIDGRLDDSVWGRAVPITTFVQREPDAGAPGSMATEARVLYTGDALYVAIRSVDPDPARIMAPLARRDEKPRGDWVGIQIDSYYDRRTAFEFAVNPAGVRRDVYRFNDFQEDPSWDAVWDVQATRDEGGWSAEFRIPLSQLRFQLQEVNRFGFNVYREIGRAHETQYWRLLAQDHRGVVSRFGDLVGLEGLARPPRMEVAPFVIARSAWGTEREPASGATGADLRFAVTPSLALSAAINPDFGQVESDPSVVTLSPQEVFFPERRPVFVEGADFFKLPLSADSFSSDALVYTRRIGRVPQLSSSGSPQSMARPTTILGAVRLLGRTAGGWSIGVLSAATARERQAGPAGQPDVTAEPATWFLAGRLSRDLRQGRTVLGGVATLVRRDLPLDATSLRSGALATGFTLLHRFRDGPYVLRSFLGASRVDGSPEAIALTQRSPAHYYQRPDIGYARFDSTRSSLSGRAGWAELARDRGAWTWGAQLESRSPGFEVNDAGFQAEAGRHQGKVVARRRWLVPGHTFRRAEVGMDMFWSADFDGRAIGRGAGLKASVSLANYTSLAVEAWRNLGGADPIALHGGPSLTRPPNYFFRFDMNTDPARAVRVSAGLTLRPRDEGVSRESRLAGTVGWRPSSRLDVELQPVWEWYRQREQYVGVARVGTSDRYVVGDLLQRTFSVDIRASYAFTPALTLQAYAQPFATAGVIAAFARVTDPAARNTGRRVSPIPATGVVRDSNGVVLDLDADGAADLTVAPPDFSVSSLRSTVVLRWEFKPGATASLVLQHHRGSRTPRGEDSLRGVLGTLLDAPGTTIALLKVSYWLSI